MALPRFIVISSNDKNDYMGYILEKKGYGYLTFGETQVVSPYAKFEVERADEDGLVHIRSCQNNKYLVQVKKVPFTGKCIAATAEKPENDQSKESCTLFKPITVDAATNTFRIMHVQTGCYLCLWPQNDSHRVLASYKVHDFEKLDIFKITDWNSLVILPKYLAFKGSNDQYLCLRYIKGYSYLQFSTNDIGDPAAAFESFTTQDGTIRIKSCYNNKFWRLEPNWIWADSSDDTSSNKYTLFRPFKVGGDNTLIGLINLGNNQFCKSLTTEGKVNCLNAATPSVVNEAKLKVEEPVMTRSIENVKYHLENYRVYDEEVHAVGKKDSINNTHQNLDFEVSIEKKATETRTWNNMFSLTLGMKVTAEFSVPKISEVGIEMSSEVQSGVEWGTTKSKEITLKDAQKIVVPPMTKMTVKLIATSGKCDVPFTYTQRDTLYNGTTVTTQVQGIYTGSNYYSTKFVTNEEKIKELA
ncbi:hypothetical protein J5N97_017971 [Dioscorea zingiberensis]|uniref:Agglutinin domain-containing protein n=1 Tax=Dioscorea zingiberensis TaxID=325984 RepID=A0A9D5HGQ3_9LILI|nr:hypothetical protein J5N97_017971 [Dioscorea zingiberensis]